MPDTSSGITSCTTRIYGFDKDSNRTELTSYPDDRSAPDIGHCTTSATPASTTHPYDQADRLTDPGYTYDALGRTTAIPVADVQGIGTHAATTGDLTVGYFANDMVASQAQGGATMSFTLDPDLNRIRSFSDGTTTTTNHYSGDSTDAPAWTSTSGGAWTRHLLGIGGDLVGTIDDGTTVNLTLTNLHGDVNATVADDTTVTAPDGYYESTEYGTPRDPASTPDTYSWLGAKQRSTNTLGGLTLMGVRLYNPTTGRFTSTDPVLGGNNNSYDYPEDPINQTDLDGRCGLWGHNTCWHHVKKFGKRVWGWGRFAYRRLAGLGWGACFTYWWAHDNLWHHNPGGWRGGRLGLRRAWGCTSISNYF